MNFLILLSSVTVFCLCVCMFLIKRRRAMKFGIQSPPMYPGALPIIGHAHILFKNSTHAWRMLKEVTDALTTETAVAVAIGPRILYLICDPDDCLTIANTHFQKDPLYNFAKSLLGEGLVVASVPTWKRHRKLLGPAYSQHVLDGFLSVFNAQSRKLINALSQEVGKGPFNHYPYIDRVALDTICKTAMGFSDAEEDILKEYTHGVQEIFHIYTQRFLNFWMHSQYVYNFTKLKKKEDAVIKKLRQVSNMVIQKRKADLGNEKKDTKFKALLEILLELAAEGALTDTEVREEVDATIMAGHDTISSALMCTLILLGSHPHVQEKVYSELQEVFEGSDRDSEKQDLSRLVYLEAVIKESLRIYPIAPMVVRQLDSDTQLKKYSLPAGSSCVLFFHGIHRLPMWGPDAEIFRPERWLEPASLPTNPSAFAAFSIGRRNCIGKAFALTSMKVTLTHILRHYKIHADHTKLEMKVDVILRPVSGHHITIERRT